MSSTAVAPVRVATDSVSVGTKMALRRPLASTPGGMVRGMSAVLLARGGLLAGLVGVGLGRERAVAGVDRVLVEGLEAHRGAGALVGRELVPGHGVLVALPRHEKSPLPGLGETRPGGRGHVV